MTVLPLQPLVADPPADRIASEASDTEAELLRETLVVALNAIPTAAFVARHTGDVLLANARGREWLASSPDELTGLLAAAVSSARQSEAHDMFQVSPIRTRTATLSYLVVEHASDSDSERRVAAAANRWQLTRAESRVFRRLAGGISNKAISCDLDCSVRTVELHVSAILKKAQARSRAALIVKLWGDSLQAQPG